METKKSINADLEHRKPLFLKLGLVLALSCALFAFEWKQTEKEVEKIDPSGDGIIDELPPITSRSNDVPKVFTPIISTSTFTITDKETDVDLVDIIEIDVPDDHPGLVNIDDEVENHTTDITDVEKVIVDFDAEYPGGVAAMRQFISENISYPNDERLMGMEGTLYVSFVVEKTGSVSNVNIIRSLNVNFDNEAIRIVKMMPKWKPAEDHGRLAR